MKTSEYYKKHPKSAEKHREYQRKLNKKDGQIEYRSELNSKRRDLGIYGKSKNGGKAAMDISHKKSHKNNGTLKDGYTLEPRKANRGRK